MNRCSRAVFFLVVAVMLSTPARAQEVRMELPQPGIADITNGAWRLRYGTEKVRALGGPQLFVVSPERAYFANTSWLRLIDTAKGVVIGRWRFPGRIEAVTPAGGGRVDVRFRLSEGHVAPNMTVRFDPAIPDVPVWDNGGLRSYRDSEIEAIELIRSVGGPFDDFHLPAPDPARGLSLVDDLIARDPSAPMFRLMRAKLLREAGDARADAAFAEVFDAASNDFTEWFRISRILDTLPQREPALAARAYDRAFRDFIGRGRDPRLVETIIARLVLFLPYADLRQSDVARRSYFDQMYPLAPTSEATERAWAVHADALAAAGDEAAAAIWRARAAVSSRESLFLATVPFQLRNDRGVLVALSSILAAVIFVVSRRVKYTPQIRMRRTAALRIGQRAESFFGGLAFWTRRERWSLLLLVIVGWLALGYSRPYAQVMTRSFAMPVRVGMISGPEDFSRYPPSDERTLLEAIGKQVVGDAAEAERLYRSVPQFAVSWNNLGVLFASAGRQTDSQEAFARALAIDPTLGEAILNSTGQATTQATETFQKYAPAGMKMTALPAREGFLRAFLGPVWTARYVRMGLGPLDAYTTDYEYGPLAAPRVIGGSVIIALLVVAIVLLTRIPRRDATVPPGRATAFIDLVFPGLAGAWQWAGAMILLLWCTAVLATVLQLTVSSPFLLMAVSQPGILRAFGYSNSYVDLNPPLTLLIGVAVGLWLANFALIRSRRARDIAS